MATKVAAADLPDDPASKSSAGVSRWVILALIFLGWCLGNMDRMSMSFAAVPIAKEFNLSASLIGLILSSFFIGYAFMQIPGGLLADRFGSRKVLLVIVFVWSVFTGLTGAAWSLAALLVIRVLFGISEAGFSPSSMKMISETFPKKETGRAISIWLMASGLMTMLTPLLAGTMITNLGWRSMFYLIGALGVVVIILYWVFLKPRPAPQETETVQAASAAKAEPRNIGELLKMPMMWNIIIVSFGIYVLSWGLNTWIPSYLVRARHLSLMSIGWLQIIPGVGMMASMYYGGIFLDKLKPTLYKAIAVIFSALCAIFLYLMYVCPTVSLFIVYQTIVYLLLGSLIVFMPAFLVKQVPSNVMGSAGSLSTFGSQLAGLVTPFVIGVLVDAFHGSFIAAFGFMIVFAIVSMVCFALLKGREEVKAKAS